jgi:flagellar assembly protein FliH
MASIIRSSDRGANVQPSAFNFDDMSGKAEAYLQQVRAEARNIIAEANKQAETIRKQAEIDGLKAAQKQHQQQVEAEAAKRMETVLPALRVAVAEVLSSKQAWLAHWEIVGVQLASRIAERILRRELATDASLPITLVRESLELAVGDDGVRVLLHPQDVERFGRQIQTLAAELKPTGKVELVGDARIEVGGCKLETKYGSIDQQLASQLRRIEEELT